MKGNKIVVLSDNRNAGEALLSEHGLSAILDTGKLRILLDTGASGQFAENAKRLGIDLEAEKEIAQIGLSLIEEYPETRMKRAHDL